MIYHSPKVPGSILLKFITLAIAVIYKPPITGSAISFKKPASYINAFPPNTNKILIPSNDQNITTSSFGPLYHFYRNHWASPPKTVITAQTDEARRFCPRLSHFAPKMLAAMVIGTYKAIIMII